MTNTIQSSKKFSPNNIKRWLLIFLVAITPSLVSFLLIISQGYRLSDFMPNFSDEVSYWNQINTFRAAGFNGGYFTINELEPPAEFTHFYTYGPWYPAIYGTLARIIGWESTTILLINTLLVGLALVVFCISTRLNNSQLLLTIVTLGTMWGLILFVLTGMQEAYQQTLAILLASFFVIALRERENTSIRVKIAGFLLISIATIMRLSWAILFLPFMLLTGKITRFHLLFYFIIFAGATGSLMLFSNYTGAPGNNSVFNIVQGFQSSFIEGFIYLIRTLIWNLGRFLFLPKPKTDVLQTYQIAGILLALTVYILQKFIHREKSSPPTESIFHLYNLGATVIAACALYIIGTGGDYRLLACHLMLSLLVMIALKHYRPVVLIIAINLICLPLFLSDFRDSVLPKYALDHTTYETFKTASDKYLVYDPQATNAWCNTLLFGVENYDGNQLVGTPAGIGLSFFKDPEEPILTFKSRYLLLNAENYALISQRVDAPKLILLDNLPTNSLYLNQSADCPEPTP